MKHTFTQGTWKNGTASSFRLLRDTRFSTENRYASRQGLSGYYLTLRARDNAEPVLRLRYISWRIRR